jgi:hypothetical protein
MATIKTIKTAWKYFARAKGFLTVTGDTLNHLDIVPMPADVRQRLDAIFKGRNINGGRSERMDGAEREDPVSKRLAERIIGWWIIAG